MTLASEYYRQFRYRHWRSILDALPPLAGKIVMDLGCGVGDLAAEFVGRGARVIGVDKNEELLCAARARKLSNAEFRRANLRKLPDLGIEADGLWCSFTAAYLPELSSALSIWSRNLVGEGWIALTEIDDLFGHEPLSASTKELLTAYTEEALAAGRYDFHMGRKLGYHLERSGFTVSKILTMVDQELSFNGAASPDVLDAWRARFQRMKLLRDFCGAKMKEVEENFLGCLQRPDHRSLAKVCCCVATRPVNNE